MQLNPYGEYAVLLAASLADDWPSSREGIVQRTHQFGMTMRFPTAQEDHAATRQVIDDWLRVVDEPEAERRAVLLNEQMAAEAAHPRLTNHDGEGWHLHYRDPDRPLPHVLSSVISVGTALHLTTRGIHRLARCAAGTVSGDSCKRVVVDITRNGTQRYCSVRCANRAAARRHRARNRSGL